MHRLRIAFLLAVALLLGCGGPPPGGRAGDANDPALTSDLEEVDPAAEAAAAAASREE